MRDQANIAAGLRDWAHGMYTLQAAAELLIRFGPPLLTGPWVEHDPDRDRHWFNAQRVAEDSGYLSGGERRVLRIAASLADPEATVDLSDALSGLDRQHLALVLAAVAHAGGSHEHTRLVHAPDGRLVSASGVRLATRRQGSLYDWSTAERVRTGTEPPTTPTTPTTTGGGVDPDPARPTRGPGRPGRDPGQAYRRGGAC